MGWNEWIIDNEKKGSVEFIEMLYEGFNSIAVLLKPIKN